ncbi:UvrD-helicase domain-containing protein [Reyranella soli]|uniref:DNA 3'-5' helicase II n=1 Tax=Reyranella soli TaxID=1230389 RepID=A0A512N4R9_9HYPH|nr:UvrD-helicase domain-containing protein [Reyranella soli]GEP53953.1 hypothetical protein RSO01_11190 [Reyranella soli]
MSDDDVAHLLRSDETLVIIEAPAGCGKTFQGASYAKDVAATLERGRLLVLAHTHAACGEFRKRTQGASNRVEVKTVASLATEIVSVYHKALDVPPHAETWAWKDNGEGFNEIAQKCADLLTRHPMIGRALVCRYPVVICDEHQDCTPHQHAILMALHRGGAKLRIFGDPLQRIFSGTSPKVARVDAERWESLKAEGKHATLEVPHRWKQGGSLELGEWILQARAALLNNQPVVVPAKRPAGLQVIVADNRGQARKQFALDAAHRKTVDAVMLRDEMLVLTSSNILVDALSAYTNRRIGIWEGHTREMLGILVEALQAANGNAEAVASALVAFVSGVGTGFSMSSHGNRLLQEIKEGCCKTTKGKPACIQEMAKLILAEPSHVGAARALKLLGGYIANKIAGFDAIKIDYRSEFGDALRLESFATPEDGLSELARRRAHFWRALPPRVVSTIHKAKGLECPHAMLIPCDKSFADTAYGRCRLYVALSRASNSLTLVVPSFGGSPLLKLE